MMLHENYYKLWDFLKRKCLEIPTDFFICNTAIGEAVQGMVGFESNDETSGTFAPHMIGTLDGIKIYVDPLMEWEDLRIIFLSGRLINLREEQELVSVIR